MKPMNRQQEHCLDKTLQTHLNQFLSQYGESGLKEALQQYVCLQQDYICKTKNTTIRIKSSDIYYLEIKGHTIHIHTNHGTYKKYGSLSHELKLLSRYHFIKCSQSCIVSLEKIRTIQNNDIILTNDKILHMSRNCAPKVLMAISGKENIQPP
jgi:DNA-binding LytR/AlgR family response regulator